MDIKKKPKEFKALRNSHLVWAENIMPKTNKCDIHSPLYTNFVLIFLYKPKTYNPPRSSVGLHVFLPGNLSVLSGGTLIL